MSMTRSSSLNFHAAAGFTPKRVVIFGKSGFIASELASLLRQHGIVTFGVGRDDVDLTTPAAIDFIRKKLRDGDCVVFAAGDIPVKSISQFENNLAMLRNFLDGIQEIAIGHLVYVSSDAVYMDLNSPITEDSIRAAESLHGIMHMAREVALQSSKFNSKLCIVRPTLVYGDHDPHNGYGPCSFMRLARNGDPISLFGHGEERRDFIHVSDVVEMIRLVIERKATGSLNLVTGEVHSFHEVAEAILHITGSDSLITYTPRVGPMPHNGYRPFATRNIKESFPNLNLKSLDEGLTLMHSGH